MLLKAKSWAASPYALRVLPHTATTQQLHMHAHRPTAGVYLRVSPARGLALLLALSALLLAWRTVASARTLQQG